MRAVDAGARLGYAGVIYKYVYISSNVPFEGVGIGALT